MTPSPIWAVSSAEHNLIVSSHLRESISASSILGISVVASTASTASHPHLHSVTCTSAHRGHPITVDTSLSSWPHLICLVASCHPSLPMCVGLPSVPDRWRMHAYPAGKALLSWSRFALREMHVLCTFPRPWGLGRAFCEAVGGLSYHPPSDEDSSGIWRCDRARHPLKHTCGLLTSTGGNDASSQPLTANTSTTSWQLGPHRIGTSQRICHL